MCDHLDVFVTFHQTLAWWMDSWISRNAESKGLQTACLVIISLDSPQPIQNMRRQSHLLIIETPFRQKIRLEPQASAWFCGAGLFCGEWYGCRDRADRADISSVTESLCTFRIVASQIDLSYLFVNLFCCSVGGPGPLKMDPHPPSLRKITPHRPLRWKPLETSRWRLRLFCPVFPVSLTWLLVSILKSCNTLCNNSHQQEAASYEERCVLRLWLRRQSCWGHRPDLFLKASVWSKNAWSSKMTCA